MVLKVLVECKSQQLLLYLRTVFAMRIFTDRANSVLDNINFYTLIFLKRYFFTKVFVRILRKLEKREDLGCIIDFYRELRFLTERSLL